MASSNLTGVERFFDEGEIIVSKTDKRGVITYANEVFLRVAGYSEEEILGKPHSIIRHPDMPRCVFKLLWDTLEAGDEIFAFVINKAKCGDHYWVLAHVTPTFGAQGQVIGYHSSRRVPERAAVDAVSGIYAELREVEASVADKRQGMNLATAALLEKLSGLEISYSQFVFSLT